MITINSSRSPSDDIHVVTGDDHVNIRFGENTLALNSGTSGLIVNNDWNDRHFTLGFGENSILYHVTRESDDDSQSGKKGVSPEEFVAEIYGYVRALAYPVHEGELDLELVGAVDFEELRTMLEEKGILKETGGDLRVDGDKRDEFEDELREDDVALGELYQRVLDPVSFEEAKDRERDEHIYVYPSSDAVFVLFFFHDKYIGVTKLRELIRLVFFTGGSQIIDHILRSIGHDGSNN